MNQKKVLCTVVITECDAIYGDKMRGAYVELFHSEEEQEAHISANGYIVAHETYETGEEAHAREDSFNATEMTEHGYYGIVISTKYEELREQYLSNGLFIVMEPLHDFDEIRLYRPADDREYEDDILLLTLQGSSRRRLNLDEYDNNLSDEEKKVVDELIEQYFSLDDALDEWIMSGPDDDDDYFD